MLLHDFLLHAERFAARRPATVDGDIRRDYAAVAARVRRAAAGLAGLGLAPGSHVAIAAENGAFFFEAYFACSLAGLVAVPVNIRLAPAEVAFILDDGDARAVLFDDACARLLDPADRRLQVRAGTVAAAGEVAWEALIGASAPGDGARPRAPEDALAHLCYTGGTTGRPKGVMLSHRNVAASTMNKIMLGNFARDDVWLHAAPMFHQADSWACFAFTALGAPHVFMPRFDALRAIELIEAHRVTALQLVPTMILMMLETPGVERRDLSAIRRVLYGSAPMPVEHLRRCTALLGPVFQHIYGLTEAAGTVAATPWPALPDEASGLRLASCGQPIVGVDMRIVDGGGAELPAGTVGRIRVRGANVMLGYRNRPEETRAALDEGWLDTGDLGSMDADGFVFIVDRAKDVIITGGENVYSTEVEHALHEHPDVLEAAVIGLPDPKWGEAVTAVVVPRGRTAPDPAALIAHCRERIAAYKCPKAVELVDALPKSAAGKVLKAELRAAAAARRAGAAGSSPA